MKIIEIKPKEIDINSFKKRTALDSDAEILINEDTIITTNGQPVIMYCKLKENLNNLRWAVNNIKYSQGKRARGLIHQSAVFGYKPKVPMRQDFCSATSMSRNHAKEHFIITEFAKNLTEYYKSSFPEVFSKHINIVQEKIKNEWVIKGTPFTSGIINKDNALKYHFDAGNFKGVLSNMVAFKKNMNGGKLVIPAYNIKLEIEDGSLSVFDGQSILHGVTPFEKKSSDAYRYTIVYYSLEQMWKCETISNELIRIRSKKKEREFKRLDNEHLEYLKKEHIALLSHSNKEYMAHFDNKKDK
jgi:hypothetical protein